MHKVDTTILDKMYIDVNRSMRYNYYKGVDIMGAYYSEAQNKATQRYQQKAYDRLAIRVYKGQADIIKAYAEAQGMSLNGYINKLIADDMGEALTTPHTAEE